MGRTPVALVKARAEKSPALADLLDHADQLTDAHIDAAPIRDSDRKLLRRALPQLISQQRAQHIAHSMPTHQAEPTQYQLWVYQGDHTEYCGLEVTPGTVVSYTDHWVRFDHLRVARKQPLDHIVDHCEFVCWATLEQANRHIAHTVNQRHGVDLSVPPPASGQQKTFTSSDFC